jgi:hypothetical protein
MLVLREDLQDRTGDAEFLFFRSSSRRSSAAFGFEKMRVSKSRPGESPR